MATKAFLNYNGRLSEGPTYNPSNNTLLWVDIIGGKVHRVKLPLTSADEYTEEENANVRESHEEFDIPNEYIGVIYLTNDDDVVYLGGKSGIAKYTFSTKEFEYKWLYPQAEKLRSNDGNADPSGRYIFQGVMGTFEYGPIEEGKLLRIDTKTDEVTVALPNVLISNGINWSKDGKTVTFTSSLDFTIYEFDYEDGELKNKRPFIKIKDSYPDAESPEPDGHALTEDGHLFTAVWSTNSVAHFNADGKLVEKFSFPASRISACSFGGKDMDELFITSANLHLDEPDKLGLNPEDLGGSLFRIKCKGHKGLIRPKLNL
ncbi:CYFA0S01e11254g1_1 [Cyberlindnera fabianii]|uniref:CYFA0S01e11254g1_1 n=1 Tax=Cyberlindnera fabianii TaxID=36022 RepID=A0A061AJ01_CYBFA|nr:CYFA0S01e11254g1_1 [Cyberlindnera fabianii]